MRSIKRGFLAVMVLITGLFILLSFLNRRQQQLSVYENRSLAAHPVFSLQSVWDGSYFRGWDDYFSDHIYHRDDRMREYQWLRLYLKRSVIVNDVVITDDVLLPLLPYRDYSSYDYDPDANSAVDRLTQLQSKVEAAGSLFLYVGVDEQRMAFADRYPSYLYSKSDYYETMGRTFRAACEKAGVHTLFLRDRLSGQDQMTYYSRVDHHFNLQGAFETYLAVCETLAPSLPAFPVLRQEQLGAYKLPGEFYEVTSRAPPPGNLAGAGQRTCILSDFVL